MQVTVKAKLSDEWVKVLKNVKTMGGVKGVKVGIFDEATTEDGKYVAFYAACNEFGTRDIPARPFMRMTTEKHSQEWARLFTRSTGNKLLIEPSVAKRAFEAIGRLATSDMHDMILSNMPPPNAKEYAEWKRNKPATTKKGKDTTTGAAGGYTGTLVYSGKMLQSIWYRLVGENGQDIKVNRA